MTIGMRMENGAKKTLKQIRLYVQPETAQSLARLTEQTAEISEADVLSIIVAAGVRAMDEHGFLPLPLEFKIQNPTPSGRAYMLNEPVKKHGK